MNHLISFAVLLCFAWCPPPARAQEPGTNPKTLPFSAARKAGNTLYISGTVARTPEGVFKRDSVAAETKQIMENIGRVLLQHGYTYDDIVSATVYLNDLGDYAEMNAAYAEFFKHGYPARACVGGVNIVFDLRVEIVCVAYKDL